MRVARVGSQDAPYEQTSAGSIGRRRRQHGGALPTLIGPCHCQQSLGPSGTHDGAMITAQRFVLQGSNFTSDFKSQRQILSNTDLKSTSNSWRRSCLWLQ